MPNTANDIHGKDNVMTLLEVFALLESIKMKGLLTKKKHIEHVVIKTAVDAIDLISFY